MSAARQLESVPAAGARVVSLDEWRACRRAAVADTVPPALRLVRPGDGPQPFRLDVFLHRARLIMGEPASGRAAFDAYPDAEPA